MGKIFLALFFVIAAGFFGTSMAETPHHPVTGDGGFASRPAPAGAAVYFITPTDGAKISGTVVVKFGLKGFGVAPAGFDAPNTGHHHILVDMAELPPLNKPLPATDHIRHFGGGQTETELQLPKGKHTLQLLVADHLHVPHAPPIVSEKITVEVE